jgi:hypothetical protein
MRSLQNRALALHQRRCWYRRQWSDAAFITMMTIGWAAGNVLAVLGCVVAAFLVIAHGDFSVFMSHIDNVASRYVAADMGRRAGFEHEVVLVLAICSAVFFLIRLPRFVMRLRLELNEGSRHEN